MRPFVSTGKEIEGAFPWVQILSLPAGSPVLNLDGGGDIPLTGLFTLSSPSPEAPWHKLLATTGVVLLLGETQDKIPPQGAPFFPIDVTTGNPQILAFLRGGISFFTTLEDPGGADLNAAGGWIQGQTRYTKWVDVSAFTAIAIVALFIGRGDNISVQVEYSLDGSQAAGALADGESAVQGPSPNILVPVGLTNVRMWVVARFARLKIVSAATVGVYTLRLAWGGQPT